MFSDIVKLILSVLGFAQNEDGRRRDNQLDDAITDRLMSLLQNENWSRRKFKTIRTEVGGFDDSEDELRRHLVRIGAKRSGTPGDGEFWELVAESEEPKIAIKQKVVQVPGRAVDIVVQSRGRNWIIAILIIAVLVVGGVAIFKKNVCSLAPKLPLVCADPGTNSDVRKMTIKDFLNTKKGP